METAPTTDPLFVAARALAACQYAAEQVGGEDAGGVANELANNALLVLDTVGVPDAVTWEDNLDGSCLLALDGS